MYAGRRGGEYPPMHACLLAPTAARRRALEKPCKFSSTEKDAWMTAWK